MSNSDLILNPEQKYVVPFFFENIVTIYVSLFGMAMLSERWLQENEILNVSFSYVMFCFPALQVLVLLLDVSLTAALHLSWV